MPRISGGSNDHWSEDGVLLGTTHGKKIVRGSYDSTFACGTSINYPGQDRLWISAGPKFVQGHNLFGTDDLCELVEAIAEKGLAIAGLDFPLFSRLKIRRGEFDVTMVDVTEMWDVGNELNARAFMDASERHARMARRGRATNNKGTLYWGQDSRFLAHKMYLKYPEIESRSREHRLPDEIPFRQRLSDYAMGTVRFESRIQSMGLKHLHLSRGEHWRGFDVAALRRSFVEQLELYSNVELKADVVEQLPRHLRGTYCLWKQGADMQMHLSRATFFRQRKALQAWGIDITTPPARVEDRVVSLRRVIEARPKGIPDWAYEAGLVIGRKVA